MTQHAVCFSHDQAMTNGQCHVMHVKVVTPGPAAIMLASPDGAGEHDPTILMVEGTAVTPGGGTPKCAR